MIDANVIKNSYLNQRNYLIIDKGHEDGITSEMGVISDQGIIGVVKSVSKNYSSVISILNQDLKIIVIFWYMVLAQPGGNYLLP